MAKTLSEDLRSRLIAAVEGGMSRRAAAERFGVAVATSIRWVRVWRTTGAVAAKARGGNRRSRIEVYGPVILAAIEAQVDITSLELARLLRDEQHASFAPSTIWRLVDRCAVTIKNSARQQAGQARRSRATTHLVQSAA